MLTLRIGGDWVRRKVRRKGKRLCERADWVSAQSVLLVVQSKSESQQGRSDKYIDEAKQLNKAPYTHLGWLH